MHFRHSLEKSSSAIIAAVQVSLQLSAFYMQGIKFSHHTFLSEEVGSTQLQASPMLPIYRGEIQVPTLGMDTVAYSPEGWFTLSIHRGAI
jgi:hypothetical protein